MDDANLNRRAAHLPASSIRPGTSVIRTWAAVKSRIRRARERDSTWGIRVEIVTKAGQALSCLVVFRIQGNEPETGPDFVNGPQEKTTMKRAFVILLFVLFVRSAEASDHRFNRTPLKAKPYAALPLGAVQPDGWLRVQLELMAQGMTGHLDEIYPQVMGPRNGWLGGDGDGWERGPYWIDGLLPLAYLLDDAELTAKVQPWIEWTLTHQTEEGYLGPVPFATPPQREPGLQRDKRRDWWPKMVMLKILQNYYTATGDKRVIDCLTKYFHYQLRELPKTPLGHWSFWGNRRGGDNLLIVLWLYNETGNERLLELAELIHTQTFAHTELWLREDSPLTKHRGMHCVNIAQGMKHPLVYSQLNPNPRHLQATVKAFADLDQHWGMPTGLFGGDEPLNSKEPTTGSEFCTATEMMFSLEKMLEISGRTAFADRLERIAFNVLPTQATDDVQGKQYYSLVNQVVCARRKQQAHLTDHAGTDVVYGVLNGYPCCTSNFHQGWPKFAQHLWYASAADGLAALVYAPCTVKAAVAGGTEVTIKEVTHYPFEDTVQFAVEPAEPVVFSLQLRIPGWCDQGTISINGQSAASGDAGEVVSLKRRWESGDHVVLKLPMQLAASSWCKGAVSLERGPLLYALRIGEHWMDVENNDSYGPFRECHPTSPWNFGLPESNLVHLQKHFQIVEKAGTHGEYPWNLPGAPIEIHTTGRRIADWQLINQTAAPLPPSPVELPADVKPEPIVLIPYGCSTLRIAEFPVVR
jgi:DUF1680 family protein